MIVYVLQERIFCGCSFDEREEPKRAGFVWDADRGQWFTDDPVIARRLSRYFTSGTAEQIAALEASIDAKEGSIEAKRAAAVYADQMRRVRGK